MKACTALLSTCCLALAGVSCYGLPVSFSFAPIVAPNSADDLFAFGISDAGVVAGTIRNPLGVTKGFSFASGQISTFEYPGATSTWAQGINNNNQVVGYFQSASASGGYVKSGSSFAAFGPGIPSEAYGINAAGQIVVSTGQNAFEITNGTVRSLDVPGASVTAALGINDQGTIVGEYDGQGFILTGTTLTTLDYPGAFVTQLDGINSREKLWARIPTSNK